MSASESIPLTESAGRPNLLGFTRQQWEEWLSSVGEPSYRASQLLKWIHQRGVLAPQDMSNIPKSLRTKLSQDCLIAPPELKHQWVSSDEVVKSLVSTAMDGMVESVLIPEGARRTLCVSSQAGCALACTFCETGRQGFSHNLSASEIIGQLWLARFGPKPSPVSNVVFMGMGEPLLNLQAVEAAASLMLDDCAYGLSRRRVTLSTAGVVPSIDKMDADLGLCLAISLHAPDDELRTSLVPINRKFNIEQLLTACHNYLARLPGRRHITVEYTLMEGINDSLEQAQALYRLLRDLRCKINLIPCNPVPGLPYKAPSDAVVDAFRIRLVSSGARATVRRPRGRDIQAACGQLAGVVKARGARRRKAA